MVYMIMNILVLLGKLEATYDYSTFYNNNNKTPINIQPFSRSQNWFVFGSQRGLELSLPRECFLPINVRTKNDSQNNNHIHCLETQALASVLNTFKALQNLKWPCEEIFTMTAVLCVGGRAECILLNHLARKFQKRMWLPSNLAQKFTFSSILLNWLSWKMLRLTEILEVVRHFFMLQLKTVLMSQNTHLINGYINIALSFFGVWG